MALLKAGIERREGARNAARRRWGDSMQARTRKALGCAVLLAYLAIYALLAASFGVWLAGFVPAWLQLACYAVAGAVWIVPVRPLFAWMNAGGKSGGGPS